jgi:hypothetical protein
MSIKDSLKPVLVASIVAFAALGAATPGEARGGGGVGGGHGGGGPVMGGGSMMGGFSRGEPIMGGGSMTGGLDRGALSWEGFTGGSNASHGIGSDFDAHDLAVARPVAPTSRRPYGLLPNYGYYGNPLACDSYAINPRPLYCENSTN